MFSYFGSKARLAPTYQAPAYDLIIEPFAGAAGYSMYWLQQRSDLRCLLIDSDPLVVEMWNMLLAMGPAELWEYPVPEVGTRSTDLVYCAASVAGNAWMMRSRGGDFPITEWLARGFRRRREQMATVLSAVRGRVECRIGDYRIAPDVDATWFIDPPYQLDGVGYSQANRFIDFPAVGEWCRSRPGQVIVCESSGADWMDFQPHVTNQTVANTQSIEVVWYSHPEPTLFDLMEGAESK